MPRVAVLLGLLLILLTFADASADEADPAAFLAEARARHLDLEARGLASFSARLQMRRSEAESLRNYRDMAGFGYAWKAPAAESFDFAGTHESLQKPLRDAFRSLYREISGRLYFDYLAALKETSVRSEADGTVFAGTHESVGTVSATFAKTDGSLTAIEFPRARTKFTFGFRPTPDGLQVDWREVVVGDAAPVRTVYRVVRLVNGIPLPTVLDLVSEKNATEFGVAYELVNDAPAHREDPPDAEVAQRVKDFEKQWRSWELTEKVAEIRALAEIPDDRASASIARLGLKQREVYVRQAAAEALGIMGRANVVPALLAALRANEAEIEVYLTVIRALGDIGDKRAVDALSRDWWNQKIDENRVAAARAKISALGRIRHVEAIDALIDTFFMAKQESIARLRPDLVLALTKLTGVELGDNPPAWKEWWKRSRARFKFD